MVFHKGEWFNALVMGGYGCWMMSHPSPIKPTIQFEGFRWSTPLSSNQTWPITGDHPANTKVDAGSRVSVLLPNPTQTIFNQKKPSWSPPKCPPLFALDHPFSPFTIMFFYKRSQLFTCLNARVSVPSAKNHNFTCCQGNPSSAFSWFGLMLLKNLGQNRLVLPTSHLDVPLEVRINGLFHLLINGVYWGYNPLTNHLLSSWDIQAPGWKKGNELPFGWGKTNRNRQKTQRKRAGKKCSSPANKPKKGSPPTKGVQQSTLW